MWFDQSNYCGSDASPGPSQAPGSWSWKPPPPSQKSHVSTSSADCSGVGPTCGYTETHTSLWAVLAAAEVSRKRGARGLAAGGTSSGVRTSKHGCHELLFQSHCVHSLFVCSLDCAGFVLRYCLSSSLGSFFSIWLKEKEEEGEANR